MVELDSNLGVVEIAERIAVRAVLGGRDHRPIGTLAEPWIVGRRVSAVLHEVAGTGELPAPELPASAEVDPARRGRPPTVVPARAHATHGATSVIGTGASCATPCLFRR